jgi:hypothetical protein
MAAPTYQAVGTAAASTGTSVNVSWPTHVADDIGVLVVETSGNSATMSTPSGWTAITGSPRTDVATIAGSKLHVFWKRAASASEAAVATGALTDHIVARIYTFRGVDPTNAIDAEGGGTKGTASTTATVPAITTSFDNTLVVMVVGRPDDSASTTHFGVPANANLTSRAEAAESGTTSGNGGGFVVSYGTKATAGSTGTSTLSKAANTTDTYITFGLREIKDPPTVALNTADAEAFSTATPTVEFTGTDVRSDDVRYGIQVDAAEINNNAYTSSAIAGGVVTTTFTYRRLTFDNPVPIIASNVYYIRVFRTGGRDSSNYFRLRGDATTASGTTRLTRSNLIWSTQTLYTTHFRTYDESVTLRDSFTLGTDVTYSFFGGTGTASESSQAIGQVFTAGASYDLKHIDLNLSKVGTPTDDFYIEINGISGDISSPDYKLIDKTSNTDPGFLNTVNGADTDPFNSGEKVSYTVQSGDALANGTYYWRVRGLDPSGSTTYGAWSDTRSFTVTTGGGGGTAGQIKVYNGSSFVAKPVKVWNGSAWVTKPVKRWNGSAWVTTTY